VLLAANGVAEGTPARVNIDKGCHRRLQVRDGRSERASLLLIVAMVV